LVRKQGFYAGKISLGRIASEETKSPKLSKMKNVLLKKDGEQSKFVLV